MDLNLQGLNEIISIGIFGNLISIGIFMKKKFAKMNAKNMFIISLLTDSIALLLAVILINPQLIPFSTTFCKIYQSLTFIIPAYSSWILVYISLERYFSNVHSTNSIGKLFGNKWFQLISLLGTFIVTLFYYTSVWLGYEVGFIALINSTYVYYDSMNSQTISACYIPDQLFQITSLMDTIYACLSPFLALITCSGLIIYTLKQSRLRLVPRPKSAQEKRREKRDYEFGKTILSLDLIFLLFHFPFTLFALFRAYFLGLISPSSPYFNAYMIVQSTFIYLSYIGYGNNIILFLIFNKDFRAEFMKTFISKK